MESGAMFTCETFNIPIPLASQVGFCAKKFRSAKRGDHCLDCEIGIESAKKDTAAVRSGIPNSKQGIRPPQKPNALPGAEVKPEDLLREVQSAMAEKKLCSCGCGKGAVKDGLATKCYRKKFGHLPFSHKDNRKAPPADPGLESGCEGCRVLTEQANDLIAIQNLLIQSGAITVDKIQAARAFIQCK